jgi:hypothetical protein
VVVVVVDDDAAVVAAVDWDALVSEIRVWFRKRGVVTVAVEIVVISEQIVAHGLDQCWMDTKKMNTTRSFWHLSEAVYQCCCCCCCCCCCYKFLVHPISAQYHPHHDHYLASPLVVLPPSMVAAIPHCYPKYFFRL